MSCIDHGHNNGVHDYHRAYDKHSGKSVGLHRLVLANKLGVAISELSGVAMHTCDNKRCINPEHLVLGTHSDNTKSAIANGLIKYNKGELNHKCKLTGEQVANIKQSSLGTRELARLYGVNHSTISRIKRGKARAA